MIQTATQLVRLPTSLLKSFPFHSLVFRSFRVLTGIVASGVTALSLVRITSAPDSRLVLFSVACRMTIPTTTVSWLRVRMANRMTASAQSRAKGIQEMEMGSQELRTESHRPRNLVTSMPVRRTVSFFNAKLSQCWMISSLMFLFTLDIFPLQTGSRATLARAQPPVGVVPVLPPLSASAPRPANKLLVRTSALRHNHHQLSPVTLSTVLSTGGSILRGATARLDVAMAPRRGRSPAGTTSRIRLSFIHSSMWTTATAQRYRHSRIRHRCARCRRRLAGGTSIRTVV